MFYVYILECKDGTYYTGAAKNLEDRINKHKQGKGAKYTAGRTPLKLVYYEECENISEAYKREKNIQKMTREEKKNLIRSIPTKGKS
ncbi:MAG: GIY-YIG nuclease family protein [Spirochaetia bacterium]|nr:GIY-YIG nuclease family protein [Spirochaetia bacterium]